MYLACHQPHSHSHSQIHQHQGNSIHRKMALSSLVYASNTPTITITTPKATSQPFYLYKGLNPEREEQLKIYPIQNNLEASHTAATGGRYDYSVYSAEALPSPPLSIERRESEESLSSISIFSLTHSDVDDVEAELIRDGGDLKNKPKFKCTHPGCRYKGTFLSKDYLRRHIREQHKRSREHICQGYNKDGTRWGCDKKFSRPYQLVNHWRGQRSLKRCGVPECELRKAGVL